MYTEYRIRKKAEKKKGFEFSYEKPVFTAHLNIHTSQEFNKPHDIYIYCVCIYLSTPKVFCNEKVTIVKKKKKKSGE